MATRTQPQSADGNRSIEQVVAQKRTQEHMNVDEAFNVLDRVIGFINNCDNKASIALGGTIAVLTIIFSDGGIEKVVNMVSVILFSIRARAITIVEVEYLILLTLSIALITVGLIFLVLTISARIKSNGSSLIYFGNIAQLKNNEVYKERTVSASRQELLEDILTQIYINSVICNKKYKNYNMGLRLTVIGLAMLVAALVISVFGR